MLAGISLTCFTASYLIALVLEATRMWFRSGLRGALLLGFAAAGLFAHTLFLANRAATTVGTPLSSEFDWFLLAAWALAAVYAVWTFGQLWTPGERRTPVGLFVLPLVLSLVAAAHFVAGREPMARQDALGVWLVIHLSTLVFALVSILVGFTFGVMELIQARRLKQKIPGRQALRLPSLEWLERAGVRSIFTSFVAAVLGLGTGIIINLVKDVFTWSDPVVWRGAAVVGWLAAAVVFLTVYKPARQGRKVAYLSIGSFIVVLISLTLGLLLPSQHGAPRKSPSAEQPASVEEPRR